MGIHIGGQQLDVVPVDLEQRGIERGVGPWDRALQARLVADHAVGLERQRDAGDAGAVGTARPVAGGDAQIAHQVRRELVARGEQPGDGVIRGPGRRDARAGAEEPRRRGRDGGGGGAGLVVGRIAQAGLDIELVGEVVGGVGEDRLLLELGWPHRGVGRRAAARGRHDQDGLVHRDLFVGVEAADQPFERAAVLRGQAHFLAEFLGAVGVDQGRGRTGRRGEGRQQEAEGVGLVQVGR